MNTASQKKTSLNTLISVMDLAGELRLQRKRAEGLLDIAGERDEIKRKILESAKISGEDLSDEEINRALDAYYEGLHRFKPAKRNFSYRLAQAYIKRNKIFLLLGIPLAIYSAIYLTVSGTSNFVESLSQKKIESQVVDSTRTLQKIKSLSLESEVVERAESIFAEIETLKLEPDAKERVNKLSLELSGMAELITREYEVRIVNKPGQKSGIDRLFTDDSGKAKVSAYYLIVEAKTKSGEILDIGIENKEDGKIYSVKQWGEEVPEQTYYRVAGDKSDDGIIDNNLFAVKKRGFLEFDVTMKDTFNEKIKRGAQITKW